MVKNDVSVADTVDSLIRTAINAHASDIHFEPCGDGLVVKLRVDGYLRQITAIPQELCGRIIIRLKVMSGIDLTEHRLPQDGRMTINENVDIRVSVLPTVRGEKAVLRILDKSLRPRGAESLGITGENIALYNELLTFSDGLILIAGPTGSGKSTTMYAMLSQLERENVSVVTLEDPVEYNVTGITQVAINERTGLTFPVGIRSVLRQDPDIIAIGEIRDAYTAETASRAALTGHLTFATIHAKSASSLPDRMSGVGVDPDVTSAIIRGVIIQRLLRRVCDECRGSGCDACGGNGFCGRIGAFGILVVPESKSATPELLSIADNALAENCRHLVTTGITTEKEAARVLGHF